MRIATESGFLDFIRFGNTVAERKKDAVKLFKLLKLFHTLNELRLDFNRMFGGKSCNGIQPSDPPQVDVHRGASPPPNGGVPRLLSFIHVYCNQLLEDDFRPTMIQVLEIHHNWQPWSPEFSTSVDRRSIHQLAATCKTNKKTTVVFRHPSDGKVSLFLEDLELRVAISRLKISYFI